MAWSADDEVIDFDCAPDMLCVVAEQLFRSTRQLPPSRRATTETMATGDLYK